MSPACSSPPEVQLKNLKNRYFPLDGNLNFSLQNKLENVLSESEMLETFTNYYLQSEERLGISGDSPLMWWFRLSVLGRRFEEIISFSWRDDISILGNAWGDDKDNHNQLDTQFKWNANHMYAKKFFSDASLRGAAGDSSPPNLNKHPSARTKSERFFFKNPI